MTRDDIFQFRCSTAWKDEVKRVAKENNVSVAALIHYTVNQILVDPSKQEFMKHVMSSKERRALIQKDLEFERE